MEKIQEDKLRILKAFNIDEPITAIEPFGNGHINDTLKVTNAQGETKYVLQKINHHIFTNVEMLQNNIQVVTSHIREKLAAQGVTDLDRKVLTFLRWRELLATLPVHSQKQKLRGGNTGTRLRGGQSFWRVPGDAVGPAGKRAWRDHPQLPQYGVQARTIPGSSKSE